MTVFRNGVDTDRLIEDCGAPAVFLANTNIKAATVSPLLLNTTGVELEDQDLMIQAIYLPYPVTLTGVGWIQHTQGDTTADNENRIGLYTSNGTSLTLVASSANSGTLWESAAGTVKKAFSAAYNAAAGRYWIGALSSWSATATVPKIQCGTAVPAAVGALDMVDTDEKILCYANNPQTSLPASLAWADTTSTATPKFFYVY